MDNPTKDQGSNERPRAKFEQPTAAQLRNCAAWNADQAIVAYRDGREDDYARLIMQADDLWHQARTVEMLDAIRERRFGSAP